MMLFDRNPQNKIFFDKSLVREYVAEKVGEEHLIPVLWEGVDSEEIPFQELPSKFVMKATHGCGYNIIVDDKTKLASRIHVIT